MKKLITSSLLVLTLSTGLLPASQALATEETGSQARQADAEQGWQKALETQVELTRTKVSLLQARSELWLEQNSEKAQRSLDEASGSLNNAWHSADKVTRVRISELKLQVDQAGKIIKEKGQKTEAELRVLADRSESVLNAAMAEVQARATDYKNVAISRYALVQVKAATLKARIALEIDHSPEKAHQALQEADNYLQQAKVRANEVTWEQVVQLQDEVRVARQAIRDERDDARTKVKALVASTEYHIQDYGKSIRETEEAKLLMQRYGQLEAQAALLKANLAAQTDVSAEQAAAYLDESKAWYDSLKSQASQGWNKGLADMSARIDETKQAVQRKDKQARAMLTDLLEQATAMVKGEEPAK